MTRVGSLGNRRLLAAALLLGASIVGMQIGALARRPVSALGVVAWARGARLIDEQHGVRQRAANDCGPAALAHALVQLGVRVEYPDARMRVRPGPDGCSLNELAGEAARFGVVPRMRRVSPPQIDDVHAPAILHLRRGHYVVLEGRSARGALRLQDPSLGLLEQSRTRLCKTWSGWVLELTLPEGGVP